MKKCIRKNFLLLVEVIFMEIQIGSIIAKKFYNYYDLDFFMSEEKLKILI